MERRSIYALLSKPIGRPQFVLGKYLAALGYYLFRLRKPPGFVGHNPLAGLMYAIVFVVYLIMVATFGSLLQPLILLVSIPFAATGALALSLITDTAPANSELAA